MTELEKRFDDYLKNIIVTGLNSRDRLAKSRYFNGKIDEFYKEEIKNNPQTTKTELSIALSSIRALRQIEFVGS